jgi:hypothetical protein
MFSACMSLIAHVLATATHELSDMELLEGAASVPIRSGPSPPHARGAGVRVNHGNEGPLGVDVVMADMGGGTGATGGEEQRVFFLVVLWL